MWLKVVGGKRGFETSPSALSSRLQRTCLRFCLRFYYRCVESMNSLSYSPPAHRRRRIDRAFSLLLSDCFKFCPSSYKLLNCFAGFSISISSVHESDRRENQMFASDFSIVSQTNLSSFSHRIPPNASSIELPLNLEPSFIMGGKMSQNL